jgi:hypothetical protein
VAWQEPRIVTLDILDDEGKTDHRFKPTYEVSLGNADEVFGILHGMLRLVGAKHAEVVEIITDGADWIWNRLDQLVDDAEIPRERIRFVLDYYHAAEHISDALAACKNLSTKERTALYDELSRQLLEADGAKRVVARLQALARGRRAPLVRKEIRYLVDHFAQIRYAQLRAENLPIGSGLVESTVRRVLNLRFKSVSKCWRDDHLEPLLYLRALLNSGRWDELISALLARRHWLGPVSVVSPTPSPCRTQAA